MSSMLRFLQARHGTTPLRFHYSQTQDLSNELLTTLLATQPFFFAPSNPSNASNRNFGLSLRLFPLSLEGCSSAHSMWAQALLMTPKRRFKLIQLRPWSSGCMKIIFFRSKCSLNPTSGESAAFSHFSAHPSEALLCGAVADHGPFCSAQKSDEGC